VPKVEKIQGLNLPGTPRATSACRGIPFYIHTNIHTKYNKGLYLPQANLAIYQKGVHYSGVKIFNNLPSDIRSALGNTRRFKNLIKHHSLLSQFGRIL